MQRLQRTLPSGALLLLLLACGSCVYPRLDGSTAPSRAFVRPEETEIGRTFAEVAAEHPGESALYVLGGGLDGFAARVALIDGAERAIDAQYYIFDGDFTGKYLLHRLLVAADRGVRVRLLLDDLGTGGAIDDLLAAADQHPRLEVRLFNPRARGPWAWLARTLDMIGRPARLNRRMHNKQLAGDGLAVIIGGRNVGDAYFAAAEGVNFGDLDLLALGPVVRMAGESFDLYWNSSLVQRLKGWSSFEREPGALGALRESLEREAEEGKGSRYAERLKRTGFVQEAERGELPLIWARARAFSDLPWKVQARGEEVPETLLITQLGDALPEAESELLIVSPYFVPRREGVAFLCGRAAAGVRVRVLTNALASSDVPAVHAGYKQYRRALLEGGVELYELMPRSAATLESYRSGGFGSKSASLHAKTFVVDRRHVFVGSLNVDPRSIDLNTELGLVIDSAELAEGLHGGIEELLTPPNSWRLSLEEGALVWNGLRDGEAVRLETEPDTSAWERFQVYLLGFLPIEGQL